MRYRSETPFDNLESSHEYVALLEEAIEVAVAELEADLALAGMEGADRRREALQLVLFNMNKLKGHMTSSRRILMICAPCAAFCWRSGVPDSLTVRPPGSH